MEQLKKKDTPMRFQRISIDAQLPWGQNLTKNEIAYVTLVTN